MSNVSIYEKNWTELVFEDRNKDYGAYQLRRENPKTTLLAFFIGILFIFALIGSWFLLTSFGNKPAVTPVDDENTVLLISDFNYPKKDNPEKEKVVVPLKKEEATKKIDKKDLVNPILVNDNPDDVKTNKEVKENPNDTEGINTNVPKTSNFTDTGTVATVEKSGGSDGPEKAVTTNELDRLPEYPGTIKEFYKYVANNIEKPDVDEHLSSISVIMSFVIEKDGSMTDIKVMRSSDKNLEREATRVLRALKVKWTPGYKDGVKIRTLYMLPIKVAL